jgi:hypothetical protein
VKAALEIASQLHERIRVARELAEAKVTACDGLPVRADRLLMRVWEDLLPLAETAGVQIQPMCDPTLIRGNEEKLASAFFSLISLLIQSCPKDIVIALWSLLRDGFVDVFVVPECPSRELLADYSTYPLPLKELEYVRGIFKMAGAEFRLSQCFFVSRYFVRLRLFEDLRSS